MNSDLTIDKAADPTADGSADEFRIGKILYRPKRRRFSGLRHEFPADYVPRSSTDAANE